MPRRAARPPSAHRPEGTSAGRRWRRLPPLLLLLVPVLGLTGTAGATPGTAPVVVSGAGAVGRDYATDRFADPWDYSNAEDLLLDDNGPAMSLSNQRITGGQLQADVTGAGYVSPLWPGYEESLLLGRDGAADGNALDASRYTTVSFSAYSSRDINAGLMWFDCTGGGLKDTCGGGTAFTLKAGWNSYVLRPTTSVYASGATWTRSWGGQLTGLRLALSPGGSASVALDWMRVSAPSTGEQVGWTNPSPGQNADLVWDTDSDRTNNLPGRPGWGVLASTSSASAGSSLSALPTGSYQVAVRSGGYYGAALPVDLDTPLPAFTNPDEDGDRDFATTVLGDPWDMSQPTDVASVQRSTGVTFAGGELGATNDVTSPYVNDPHVYLRTGGALDATAYHRITLTTHYDGPFDLRDIAGGGTMGRVMWRRSDLGSAIMQTKPILTYTDRRTVTLDLGMPTDVLTEPTAGDRNAFVSPAPVTELRWDPNEDRGPRRWYVDDVQLKSDFVATGTFPVKWDDGAYRPGGIATIVADTDRTGCDGRTVAAGQAVVAGENVSPWNVTGVPPGRYWLCITEVRGGAVVQQYAKAPVVVPGPAPAPPPAPPAPAPVARGDLFLAAGAGTGSGLVEVHALSRSSRYAAFSVHAGSALGVVDPATTQLMFGSYDGTGKRDLYVVQTSATGSGRVEVHVLSAASGYQQWVLHVATPLAAVAPGQWQFRLSTPVTGGAPDLVGVLAAGGGSGRVELHALSRASNYTGWSAHVATALSPGAPGAWDYLVGPSRGGAPAGDLIGVTRGATGSGRTEVHVLSQASGYAAFSVHAATPLGVMSSPTAQFSAADVDGNGSTDLVMTVVAGTGSGRTEVHTLSGSGPYQDWLDHAATGLGQVDPHTWGATALS